MTIQNKHQKLMGCIIIGSGLPFFSFYLLMMVRTIIDSGVPFDSFGEFIFTLQIFFFSPFHYPGFILIIIGSFFLWKSRKQNNWWLAHDNPKLDTIMNKKIFYILLVVLSGYGILMSELSTMGSHQDGSIFRFFNPIGDLVSSLSTSIILPRGISNYEFTNWYMGIIFLVGNLIAWLPISFLISCIPFKKIFSK